MRKGHMHRYEWSRDNDSGTAATRKSPWLRRSILRKMFLECFLATKTLMLQHHTSRPGRGRVGNHDPAMAGSRAPAVTQAPKRRAWAGAGALGLGWVSGVLRS